MADKTQKEIDRDIARYLDTKKGARIGLYEEKDGDRCNYMNESASHIRPGPESVVYWTFAWALGSIGGTVWLIFGVGWSLHLLWLLLLGPFSLLFLWHSAEMVRDFNAGSVELVGTVTEMSTERDDDIIFLWLHVQGRAFSVTLDIYNWVSEGEEVAVKFWPRTNVVDTVRKLPKGFKLTMR